MPLQLSTLAYLMGVDYRRLLVTGRLMPELTSFNVSGSLIE